jgi:hypothetical protein
MEKHAGKPRQNRNITPAFPSPAQRRTRTMLSIVSHVDMIIFSKPSPRREIAEWIAASDRVFPRDSKRVPLPWNRQKVAAFAATFPILNAP